MKYFLVMCVLLSGCLAIRQYDEIIQTPVQEWSREDCLTVLLGSSVNNYFIEDTRVRMAVVPFSPLVISAFSRLEQYKKQLHGTQLSSLLEARFLEDVGLYFDSRTGRTFDARGNYYRDITQVDSFMVLLNLMNKTFPCVSPLGIVRTTSSGDFGMRPIIPGYLNDYPCYTPDISDLETRIFLENDKQELLKPRFVFGRRQNVFQKEETLLILFPLRQEGKHFFTQSSVAYLRIHGLDGDMRIEIPLKSFQAYPYSNN
ncbi:MAG: hypothetical protein HY960_06160 [Ignavibacteriae bacterium]|nr:hypothetical protein [Ignavibacteriota bacterium]